MPCPVCGAPGVDDPAGCEALFQEVCGLEFSDPQLFGVHPLTVDAYSLQHPETYMKSPKSAAAHLAGICCQLELGAGAEVSRAVSDWLSGAPAPGRVTPPPPLGRGERTVRSVWEVRGSAEHSRRVRAWAADAWAAWGGAHETARRWADEVMGRRGRRRS